jgi:hypothetical protein
VALVVRATQTQLIPSREKVQGDYMPAKKTAKKATKKAAKKTKK